MVTLYLRPASVTGSVQVVQPSVWPGFRWAVSVVPPSVTTSPSCRTLSMGCSFPSGRDVLGHELRHRPRHLLHYCIAGLMVGVSVAGQNDFGVLKFEA